MKRQLEAEHRRRLLRRASTACQCTLDYRCSRHSAPRPASESPRYVVDVGRLAATANADPELLSAVFELGREAGLSEGAFRARTRVQLESLAKLEKLYHAMSGRERVAAICAQLGIRRARYYSLRKQLSQSSEKLENDAIKFLQAQRPEILT